MVCLGNTAEVRDTSGGGGGSSGRGEREGEREIMKHKQVDTETARQRGCKDVVY